MIFGFNTDIKVGQVVFHIQTEDRGEVNPTIDTTIYFKGRVLAKRAVSYKEFFESKDFDPAELKEMVERHHKKWVEAVRNSEIDEMKEIQEEEARKNEPIKIELLNPSSIFHAARIQVEAGVKRVSNGDAVEGAVIAVRFSPDGAAPVEAKGKCNRDGKAEVSLPLPKIGPKGADLYLQVQHGKVSAELRFSLRPRQAAKS